MRLRRRCFFAVRRGEHHRVSVRVGNPQLAVPGVRVVVDVEDHASAEVTGPADGIVEVVDLEPQHHTVADRLVRVPEVAVMVVGFPGVQLENQPVRSPGRVVETRVVEPLVLARSGTVVAALVPAPQGAPEKLPVEPGRCLDISNHDEGLRSHLL